MISLKPLSVLERIVFVGGPIPDQRDVHLNRDTHSTTYNISKYSGVICQSAAQNSWAVCWHANLDGYRRDEAKIRKLVVETIPYVNKATMKPCYSDGENHAWIKDTEFKFTQVNPVTCRSRYRDGCGPPWPPNSGNRCTNTDEPTNEARE